MEQLRAEVKDARRAGEDALLVVHGYGASGVGGAIKAALASELPRLARLFDFRVFSHSDKDRVPEWLHIGRQDLSPGSTLLMFRQIKRDKEPTLDFRPNFRELRKRVRVPGTPSGAAAQRCQHEKRQLLSRGPDGSTYKCRRCGMTFAIPKQR
jgi:hypothetical protein